MRKEPTVAQIARYITDEDTALELLAELATKFGWTHSVKSRADINVQLHDADGHVVEEWLPITDEEFNLIRYETPWSVLGDELSTSINDVMPTIIRRQDGTFYAESF